MVIKLILNSLALIKIIQTLFIEAKKVNYVNKIKANKIFNNSKLNFNKYSRSILYDKTINKKIKNIKYK